MRHSLLSLMAIAGAALAPCTQAVAAAQRLYVHDTASGKNGAAAYVEYGLPNLNTLQYSPAYNFSNKFGVRNGTLYFANQNQMFSIPKGTGLAAPTLLFGAPYSTDVTVDSHTHLYAIDGQTSAINEFSPTALPAGATKTPFRILHLAPNQANLAVADHQDNLWVALNNNTLAVYGPSGAKPIMTLNLQSAIADIKVDTAGTVWVLTGGIEPYPFTGCTPDPDGNVKRFPLIYSYKNLSLNSTLYSHENDTNGIGHLAVAGDDRVYYSAGNEILDYDPGAECPTDALTVSNLSTYASAPMAIDQNNHLYASDSANGSIYAYPAGSPTPLRVVQQTQASQGVQLEVH